MSTILLPRPASGRTRSTLGTLARIEARRFARHPLFLFGAVLGLWAATTTRDEVSPSVFDYPAGPAFFVGLLGFVVAYRLTTSTRTSAEAVDGCPVATPVRTAALALACLVPFAAGTVIAALEFGLVRSAALPVNAWGTYGNVDSAMILLVGPAVMCLGGPLLGVAAGRWVRFPGAALLLAALLVAGSMLAGFATMETALPADSVAMRVAHVLTPYTVFGSTAGESQFAPADRAVVSYTGSPAWYVAYLVCLTGLALVAALLSGAEGGLRRRLHRLAMVLTLSAVGCLAFAALGGNQAPMLTQHDGTTVVRVPAG